MNCNTCQTGMNYVTFDLHQCPVCQLISSEIKPDLELYDKSYLRKYERYERTNVGININKFRLQVVREIHNSYEKLLDFGCGSGSFVRACIKQKIKAVGFDINPYSEYCDISLLFNGHSTVTFWDSLEHLSNPKQIIKGLNGKLIFVSTPSTDGHDNINLYKWKHYYPGEHVHYYNERSLIELLTVCGYSIVYKSYGESECRRGNSNKNILTVGGIK